MEKRKFEVAKIPSNEKERLLALRALRILDTEPEFELDQITVLASRICGTSVSMISLIDDKRQWFKSTYGMKVSELPRDTSFCGHAINNSETFIVEDAKIDLRFMSNPHVLGEGQVRFYAGAPLITTEGFAIGTLCVSDQKPLQLSPEQINSLEILARQVVLNFERKRIDRETRIQKIFFINIVDVIPQLISYIDSNYNYLFRNSAYQKWFKLSDKDLEEVSIRKLFGDEAFFKAKPLMDKAFGGHQQSFESSYKVECNGVITEIEVQSNYIPDFASDGSVQGLFSVTSDLTKLNQRERLVLEQAQQLKIALYESQSNEKAFKAYFENSIIGIVKLNSKFQFYDANPAYLKLMGYTLAELKKMTINEVTHPDDRYEYNLKISGSSFLQALVIDYEKRNITKSGGEIVVRVSGQAVSTDYTGEEQLFMMVQDITSLKEAEKSLQNHQAKMIQSSKLSSLGEMAGGIAHEINNPLAIILGKLDKLARVFQEDRDNEVLINQELEKIRLTAIRIAKIIQSLRAFSRDGSTDPFESIEVSELIDNTVDLCSERFAIAGVKLIVENSLSLHLKCRPTDISQILLNLLNNAFDAIQTAKNKWIKIQIIEDSLDQICISVTDSGPGISSSIQDKIMQPFFTTKDVGKGTGLGLSISKGLAEAHGGQLLFNTDSPHTCFLILLPRDQDNYLLQAG